MLFFIKPSKSKESGFTLIEPIMVILVIAILKALLLPGNGERKEDAKASACVKNLRQLAALATLCCADTDGRFPDSTVYIPGQSNGVWYPARSRHTLRGIWGRTRTAWI